MELRRFTIIKDKPPTSEKELENKARVPDDIEKYLKNGGQITVCKPEETTPSYVYKAWNNIGLREVL